MIALIPHLPRTYFFMYCQWHWMGKYMANACPLYVSILITCSSSKYNPDSIHPFIHCPSLLFPSTSYLRLFSVAHNLLISHTQSRLISSSWSCNVHPRSTDSLLLSTCYFSSHNFNPIYRINLFFAFQHIVHYLSLKLRKQNYQLLCYQ